MTEQEFLKQLEGADLSEMKPFNMEDHQAKMKTYADEIQRWKDKMQAIRINKEI